MEQLPVSCIFSGDVFSSVRYGGIYDSICLLSEQFIKMNVRSEFYGLQTLSKVDIPSTSRWLPIVSSSTTFKNLSLRYSPYLLEPLAIARHQRAGLRPVVHRTFHSKPPSNRRAPSIVEVPDLIPDRWLPKSVENKNWLEKKTTAILSADHIIAHTNYVKNQLIDQLGISDSEISVISLAPSTRINPSRPSVKDLGRYILFVGHRTSHKNFKTLVQAFSYLSRLDRGLRLVAYGGSNPSAEDLSTIAEMNLRDRVIFLTDSEHDLRNLYSNALVFVYPSLDEGFGIPPLEAMAERCVVASSSAGPMREVLGDAAIYFNPQDANEMSQVIQKAIEDNVLRSSLLNAGMIQTSKYSYEKAAVEHLAVYSSVANSWYE